MELAKKFTLRPISLVKLLQKRCVNKKKGLAHSGHFSLRDTLPPVIMVASGVGIAPFMSFLKEMEEGEYP